MGKKHRLDCCTKGTTNGWMEGKSQSVLEGSKLASVTQRLHCAQYWQKWFVNKNVSYPLHCAINRWFWFGNHGLDIWLLEKARCITKGWSLLKKLSKANKGQKWPMKAKKGHQSFQKMNITWMQVSFGIESSKFNT